MFSSINFFSSDSISVTFFSVRVESSQKYSDIDTTFLICCSHRELASWLSYYSRAPQPRDAPVRGPVLLWWAHLLLIPFFYPLLVICSQILPQKGWIVLVGMAAMSFTLYAHGHRIKHVCRYMLSSHNILSFHCKTAS